MEIFDIRNPLEILYHVTFMSVDKVSSRLDNTLEVLRANKTGYVITHTILSRV